MSPNLRRIRRRFQRLTRSPRKILSAAVVVAALLTVMVGWELSDELFSTYRANQRVEVKVKEANTIYAEFPASTFSRARYVKSDDLELIVTASLLPSFLGKEKYDFVVRSVEWGYTGHRRQACVYFDQGQARCMPYEELGADIKAIFEQAHQHIAAYPEARALLAKRHAI